MTEDTTEVYSLLIPLDGRQLLIPRSNVMEVVSLTALEDHHDGVTWLLGSMEWAGSLVPVMSFEGLCGDPIPANDGRTRVVLFRCLTDALSSRAFGLVSQGFPQLVRVKEDALELNQPSVGDALPILCQVTMASQTPLIPDIEQLEHRISDALAVTS